MMMMYRYEVYKVSPLAVKANCFAVTHYEKPKQCPWKLGLSMLFIRIQSNHTQGNSTSWEYSNVTRDQLQVDTRWKNKLHHAFLVHKIVVPNLKNIG